MVGPKTQILGTSFLCEYLKFSKFFELCLYNYEDTLWSKFQLNLTWFTEFVAPDPPKWTPPGQETKKVVSSG